MTIAIPAQKNTRGWLNAASGMFGAAAGSLATALTNAARENPLALVALLLGLLLIGLLVAVAGSWLSGSWVHIREVARADQNCAEARIDRDRWRDQALTAVRVNEIAVPKAVRAEGGT